MMDNFLIKLYALRFRASYILFFTQPTVAVDYCNCWSYSQLSELTTISIEATTHSISSQLSELTNGAVRATLHFFILSQLSELNTVAY